MPEHLISKVFSPILRKNRSSRIGGKRRNFLETFIDIKKGTELLSARLAPTVATERVNHFSDLELVQISKPGDRAPLLACQTDEVGQKMP